MPYSETNLKITKTRLLRDRIQIGSRSYRRFIPYPGPIFDQTPRCIGCGQIDEPEYHNGALCEAACDFLRPSVVTRPSGG